MEKKQTSQEIYTQQPDSQEADSQIFTQKPPSPEQDSQELLSDDGEQDEDEDIDEEDSVIEVEKLKKDTEDFNNILKHLDSTEHNCCKCAFICVVMFDRVDVIELLSHIDRIQRGKTEPSGLLKATLQDHNVTLTQVKAYITCCLLYTSPSPRDRG